MVREKFKKDTQKNKKEIFKLWISFLKLSSDYRTFCELFQKRKKDSSFKWPPKFQKASDGSAPKELSNYITFGNIFDPRWDFDKWWKLHSQKMDYSKTHRSPQAITDYTETIDRDIDITIDSFKRREGREPTLQEFKISFLKMLKEGHRRTTLFLEVDVADRAPEDLSLYFEKVVRRKQKDPYVEGIELSIRKNRNLSQTYIPVDKFKLYYEVYCFVSELMKQQGHNKRMATEKAIKFFTGEDVNDLKNKGVHKGDRYASVMRKYEIYFEKAERIIKNVELGLFPFKYEKPIIRKQKSS
ncbi:MAG: hypothetical protein OEW04_03570 [Nitrospirota bacterium]|nr:hypothetical protein [Nitrospirota bacterium]